MYSDRQKSLSHHQQKNKWYPQRCLLVHFEATFDFSRIEFTCPYIITYGYVIMGK